jgi:hypothetical protein
VFQIPPPRILRFQQFEIRHPITDCQDDAATESAIKRGVYQKDLSVASAIRMLTNRVEAILVAA